MPYKQRLRKKGVNERPFAHAVKLCWFILQFEDVHHKYSLKYFCEHFEEIVKSLGILEILHEEYGIEWCYYNKDKSLCAPNYDTVTTAWIKNNEWKEQYPIFKADRLATNDMTELEKYIRQKSYFNRKDSESMRTCYDKEDEYSRIEAEPNGRDMTYYRNKNQETITNIEERWRKRLGLDKEEQTEPERIPVSDNPEHENQDVRDTFNDLLWGKVEPRK